MEDSNNSSTTTSGSFAGSLVLRATKRLGTDGLPKQQDETKGLTVVHQYFKDGKGSAESASKDHYHTYEPTPSSPSTTKYIHNTNSQHVVIAPPPPVHTPASPKKKIMDGLTVVHQYYAPPPSAKDTTQQQQEPEQKRENSASKIGSVQQQPSIASPAPATGGGKEGLTAVQEYFFRQASTRSENAVIGDPEEEDTTSSSSGDSGQVTLSNVAHGPGLTQVCVKIPMAEHHHHHHHDTHYDEDSRAISQTASHTESIKMDALLSQNIQDGFSHTIFPKWSRFTHFVHSLITRVVVTLAVHAARNPKAYVVTVLFISTALISAGFATNFNINTDEQEIYAPFQSLPKEHSEWIANESDFPGNVRIFSVAIHKDGDNVLGHGEHVRKVFEAVDYVKAIDGYKELCAMGDYVNFAGETTCKVMSVTRFFQHDRQVFEEFYAKHGEEGLAKALSEMQYENGTPVDTALVLGKAERDADGQLVESKAFLNYFQLPMENDEYLKVEKQIIKDSHVLRDEWSNDETNPLTLDFFTFRSYSDEFMRAIQYDLVLLPIVFALMSGFTCLVFFRTNKVHSRSLLGMGSVLTIACALMSSFGIMFCIGIPFTSMTQLLPFIAFGVGLDDTFIITGGYFRTDPTKDPVDRIRETMEDVGLSISVTTITTVLAFVLGSISSIPSILWLNLYAIPTLAIDFLYQITFFVALIVLDERRVQANKRDLCVCIVARGHQTDDEEDSEEEGQGHQVEGVETQHFVNKDPGKSFADVFVCWYTRQLMRPWVKAIVIVGFLAYAGVCGYTTTLLRQEFDISELLPQQSYVKDFLVTMDKYSSRILSIAIYFRDVDQMDPEILRQMNDFVDEVSALPQIGQDTPFCWFRDLKTFKDSDMGKDLGLEDMTFQEQVDLAFSIPAIQETYGNHVVFNENGTIVSSRCYNYMTNIDLKVVKDQINMLKDQQAVSARQPINQGKEDQSFFTFDRTYFLWEFYAVAVEELIFTTVTGVLAVCFVGFFFIPHWGAILFVFPMIAMVYIDLLGTIQMCGLSINAVTYVCLVISIGLLVDFIVHVLLRYYESAMPTREAKVIDTLETMGASILVGGLSTLLGTLPLAFGTSEIMSSVFVSFFSMVAIGVTHGLVFLPVLLSIIGPVTGGHMPPQDVLVQQDKKLDAHDSDTEESKGSVSVPDDLHLEEQCDDRKAVTSTPAAMTSTTGASAAPTAARIIPNGIQCSFDTEQSNNSRQGSFSRASSHRSSSDESSEDATSTESESTDHERRRSPRKKDPPAASYRRNTMDPLGTSGDELSSFVNRSASSKPSQHTMSDTDNDKRTDRDAAGGPSKMIRDESLEVVFRTYTLPSPRKITAAATGVPTPSPTTPSRKTRGTTTPRRISTPRRTSTTRR